MCKLQYNRVFRFLVCLFLVLSLLVNLSPLKAEATAVVGAALTFDGLMAALYSLSIGICATAFTVDVWNKVGQTFRNVVTDTGDSTIIEAWVDLEAMYDAYIPGGGNDPDDELKWTEKLKTALSRGLLGAIAGWLCTLVNMGGYEVENSFFVSGGSTSYLVSECLSGSTSSTDYTYSASSPFYLIAFYGHNSTHNFSNIGIFSDQSITVTRKSSSTVSKSLKFNSTYNFYYGAWGASSSSIPSSYIFTCDFPIVDLGYIADSTTFGSAMLDYCGSWFSSQGIEVIEPSIYVGDIPEQIQNGDKDEDNLILPIIDPFRVIQSPETALEDMNQLQQQLANGTTTLDQYLEQVTYQEPTQPDNPSTDPTSPTSPSVDPDPWEPPEDPGKFALDLSKVFPFCIPFDLYAFLTCLNADPVTPVIHWEIAMPGGGSYPLTIDLSPFDSVAQLLRRLELLLFCIALAMKTRDLIKG